MADLTYREEAKKRILMFMAGVHNVEDLFTEQKLGELYGAIWNFFTQDYNGSLLHRLHARSIIDTADAYAGFHVLRRFERGDGGYTQINPNEIRDQELLKLTVVQRRSQFNETLRANRELFPLLTPQYIKVKNLETILF